jgi:hypothetical protein
MGTSFTAAHEIFAIKSVYCSKVHWEKVSSCETGPEKAVTIIALGAKQLDGTKRWTASC